MNTDNPRFVAYQVLQSYYPGETNLSQLLNKVLSGLGDFKDKGFVREIAWGVARYLNTLDYHINSFLEKKSLKTPIRNILRIGAFQLLYFTNRVPEYAAINETVELAKISGQSEFAPLCNAVLRKIQGAKTNLKLPEKDKNSTLFYAVKYSHPEWLVQRWIKRFGEEEAEKLLLVNNRAPGLTIRANTLKVAREELRQKLEQEGFPCHVTEYSPQGILLYENPELEALESFRAGLFVVQDEASQLVSYLLAPKEGASVLDLCSGSGVKAMHIYELSKGKAKIKSVDNSSKQLETAQKNFQRAGITGIELINEDVLKLRNVEADYILLDAPCSGLGAIRRKPDIKWNRSEKMLKKFSVLQKAMLHAASGYLKTGGTLVYSTCTVEPEENEEVIFDFLKKHKNFEVQQPRKETIPAGLLDETGYFLKTYPHRHIMDGFFAAILKRMA